MNYVYVIQIPKRGGYKLDISEASKFGEIKEECFNCDINVSENSEEVIDRIYDYLSDIKEGDYILQAGEHTLFTLACVVASGYVDSFNIIRWERNFNEGKRSGGYYSIVNVDMS